MNYAPLLQLLNTPAAHAAFVQGALLTGFVGLGFLINTKVPALGALLRGLDY
jgi:hypothetical protein